MTNTNLAKWYIVNAFPGNEDVAKENILKRAEVYGIKDQVADIAVIKQTVIRTEEISIENSPKSMRNTRRITWSTLANGNLLKTTRSEENRFGGYIFIKMIMNDHNWFLVRNTTGVTGVLGSSGKGTKPFPISGEEMLRMMNIKNGDEVKVVEPCDSFGETGKIEIDYSVADLVLVKNTGERIEVPFYAIKSVSELAQAEDMEQKMVEESRRQTEERNREALNVKIGDNVLIQKGIYEGENGTVKSINLAKGTLILDVEMFQRLQEAEVSIDDVTPNF